MNVASVTARRLLTPPVAAAFAAAVVFLPSIWGGFLYDDVRTVVHNRGIRDLTQPTTVWLSDPARPLLAFTWALNYAISGVEPGPYHAVNVGLHAANAALAAMLFAWIAAHMDVPSERRAAVWLSALWFAVTPMAVETVAYVSSRSTALASSLMLACLVVAVGALEATSVRRLAAAFALFALALAAKEEAASLPLYLLSLDYFFLARRDARAVWSRRSWHAPFVLLPLLGLIARRQVTGEWLPPGPLPVGTYAATQASEFFGYWWRAALPIDPAFFRHAPSIAWPPSPGSVFGLVALAALIALAWHRRRDAPLLAFATAWLAVGLAPSSTIVPLREMVVDHRAYLGGLGVIWLVSEFTARRFPRPVAVVVLVAWSALAVRYQWVLKDPVRAWRDAVARAPESVEARRALSAAYAQQSDPRAADELRRALELAPDDAHSWANLGVLYAQQDRIDDALDATARAAQLAPGDARIRDNYGVLLFQAGNHDAALAEFEAAVVVDPPLAQTRIHLAEVLVSRREFGRARSLLAEAAALEIDESAAAAIERLRAQIAASGS